MKLKQSPFIHIVPVDDEQIALYHSLDLEVAFVDRSFLAQCYRDGWFISRDAVSERALELLKSLGFLLAEGDDGYEHYNQYRNALEKPAINILYLLLTDACNIRCRYCYFLANMPPNYRFSRMKRETARAAVDFFARCVQRSIADGHRDQQVVIYGGGTNPES